MDRALLIEPQEPKLVLVYEGWALGLVHPPCLAGVIGQLGQRHEIGIYRFCRKPIRIGLKCMVIFYRIGAGEFGYDTRIALLQIP